MSEEEIQGWKDYRDSLSELKSKSDDDFEKYINYISAGGLGLTVTFIDNIVPLKEACNIWVIAIGWILLTTTLLLNLYSHYKSSKFSADAIDDVDNKVPFDVIIKNRNKQNKIITNYNIWSLRTLILGIIFVIAFVILNSIL